MDLAGIVSATSRPGLLRGAYLMLCSAAGIATFSVYWFEGGSYTPLDQLGGIFGEIGWASADEWLRSTAVNAFAVGAHVWLPVGWFLVIATAFVIGSRDYINEVFLVSAPATLMLALSLIQQAGESAIFGLICWFLATAVILVLRILLEKDLAGDWGMLLSLIIAPVVGMWTAPYLILAWVLGGSIDRDRSRAL